MYRQERIWMSYIRKKKEKITDEKAKKKTKTK